MCLDIIDSKEDTIKKYGKSGYGWKVFSKEPDGMLAAEMFSALSGPYKIGKRYTAFVKKNFLRYTLGFHVFKTREGARNWSYSCPTGTVSVRKVKWSHPVASGGQHSALCRLNNKPPLDIVVAKYMTILPLKEKE
jgi:hypothetical protein